MLCSRHIRTQEDVISDHQSVLTTSTCETMPRSNVTDKEYRGLLDLITGIIRGRSAFNEAPFEVHEVRTMCEFVFSTVVVNRFSDEQIREIIQEVSAEVERANAPAVNANVDRPRDVAQDLEVAVGSNSGVSSLSGNETSSASSIAGGGNRAEAALALVNMGNVNPNNAAAGILEDPHEN